MDDRGGYDLDSVMMALADLGGNETYSLWKAGKFELAARESKYITTLADTAKRGDQDANMAKVPAWAKSNPGKVTPTNLHHRKRNIGTMSNTSSIFAD